MKNTGRCAGRCSVMRTPAKAHLRDVAQRDAAEAALIVGGQAYGHTIAGAWAVVAHAKTRRHKPSSGVENGQ